MASVCEACNGTGTEWAESQPMTIDDLAEMCGDLIAISAFVATVAVFAAIACGA